MTKQQYVTYLIATRDNFTCTNLADHSTDEQATSHDAVTDFLCGRRVTPRSLWDAVRPRITDGPEAFLIVDDSVQDKRYSEKIELTKVHYSGAAHGLVRGIDVVNLLHTTGASEEFWPIDFRVYAPDGPHGDGKTKNDHFREMLKNAWGARGIQASTVLFDAWYASVDNLKMIHRAGKYFVTTLKENRLVSLSKETGYVHLNRIDWTPERLANGLMVKLKELPFLVRLFKIVAPDGDIDWVITNREQVIAADGAPHSITTADVRQQNAFRWRIEQMHRELKQLVGSAKCQCRRARSQRNHLAYAYLAWASLKVHALRIGATLYRAKDMLFDAYLVAELRHPTITVVCVA